MVSTTRTGGNKIDVDDAEAFSFYEINLHLHYESNHKH